LDQLKMSEQTEEEKLIEEIKSLLDKLWLI
jgi:hypothetical protein